jgi:hypothetical protein
MSQRAIAKASFSAHGGKVAIAIFGGEVHVFSGVALTPIHIFSIQVMSSHLPAPAFSPTSCCLAFTWHDHKSNTCALCIVRIPSVTSSTPLMWDHHLAVRYIVFFFIHPKPQYVYLLSKFHCASSLLVFV